MSKINFMHKNLFGRKSLFGRTVDSLLGLDQIYDEENRENPTKQNRLSFKTDVKFSNRSRL
jgi:hypothetical protein